MIEEQTFRDALSHKKVPILTLDQKWHRLFAIHGKPQEIQELETQINTLLARQGKLNNELKELKKSKSQLMSNIVQNMDGTANNATQDAIREKRLDTDSRLIDEINEKLSNYEDELLELPNQIKTYNEELMIRSMEYFYEKIRINKQEAKKIDDWLTQVRIDLKKNVIRKQNREINNREMYAYLHDILGPEVLDLFDIQLDNSNTDESDHNS